MGMFCLLDENYQGRELHRLEDQEAEIPGRPKSKRKGNKREALRQRKGKERREKRQRKNRLLAWQGCWPTLPMGTECSGHIGVVAYLMEDHRVSK